MGGSTRLETKQVYLGGTEVHTATYAKEIFTRMLQALKCPHISGYTGDERRTLALQLTGGAGIKLLIIDELQDLLHSTARQRMQTLVAIKDVMNSLLVPTVALGTEDAKMALESDQHLRARFRFRDLPLWKNDQYFAHFLDEFEVSLALRRPSRLSSPTIRRVLLALSGGRLADITDRIQCAAALSIESGEERVTPELLARAEFESPRLTGARE